MILPWLLLLILVSGSTLWLRWRYKNRRLLDVAKTYPGPPTWPLLGNGLDFICQPEKFVTVIRDYMTEYGDAIRIWFGANLNFIISNPDDLRILLSSSKTSFKGPLYNYMADVLGGGILSGSGPTWRKHRKIATPNYGKRAVGSYSDIFNKEVDLLLGLFRTIDTSKQFNIYEKIVQTTSYSVCQTLMGLSKEQTNNLPYLQSIIEQTHRMYDIAFERMRKWYLQIDPIFWITNFNKDQKNFVRMITEFSQTIVRHRREKLKTVLEKSKIDLMNSEEDNMSNTQLSVIDRFILSTTLEEDELLNETFTVFTSSQEASAKISSYILLMMAYHPKCQKKMYAEIRSVIGDKDRHVTDEDLKRMPYLEQIFKEAIRLFPIGAILQRSINEDIEISSGTLPAGSSLIVPTYHLHRAPRFWDRPDDFDPERFSSEHDKRRHPYCYIPFSYGPMDCLGRFFATKLIKTICVRVLQEFEISSLDSYKDLKPIISISTVPVDGFNAILTPRNRNGYSETVNNSDK